ncbi:MAG: sucrase ferredoxin, partial [Nocardioidaceae bacterium]
TASYAQCWIALEQPGPWGRDAAAQSHLDAELGRELANRLKDAGGRLVLVRSTGTHADDHHGGPRNVFVASSLPGREWLLHGLLDDPRQLLVSLDVDALRAGDRQRIAAALPALQPRESPVLLVCTNGRRDVCCAMRGRPVAHAASELRPGQVWETSHTGGHRFAPTVVVLPSGLTLARLTAHDAVTALDAAATGSMPAELMGPRHDRGRSALLPQHQAADSAARAHFGEASLSALTVDHVTEASLEGGVEVSVSHADGRRIRVQVAKATRPPDRRVSCGKPVEPQVVYDVQVVDGA